MNHTPKTRLEELLSTPYPVMDGLQYTKTATINSVQKIGAFCNNVFFLWASVPRNDEERQDESQANIQDARQLVSDFRTGAVAVSAVAVGMLVAKKIV